MLSESRYTFRTLVNYTIIILVIVILVAYSLWQARLLIVGPVIKLTDSPDTIQTGRTITLSGSTANITGLSLNGRAIYTDQSGKFSEHVILENGYTLTTLEATDRYGRKTRITKSFVYNKDSG